MIIYLDPADEEFEVRDEGSVVLFTGRDPMGRVTQFAADWRPASNICLALEADGPLDVDVDSWQILWTDEGE
jgi:hypothetical protein